MIAKNTCSIPKGTLLRTVYTNCTNGGKKTATSLSIINVNNLILNMFYFGTNLTEYGHCPFFLGNGKFEKLYGLIPKDTPFDVERLTNHLKKGQVAFYQGGGFTAIAIGGSCKDDRPGTKSVFWLKENLTREQMKDRILTNPVSKDIIDAFKFMVQWEC
jgi:hypothetical protein